MALDRRRGYLDQCAQRAFGAITVVREHLYSSEAEVRTLLRPFELDRTPVCRERLVVMLVFEHLAGGEPYLPVIGPPAACRGQNIQRGGLLLGLRECARELDDDHRLVGSGSRRGS